MTALETQLQPKWSILTDALGVTSAASVPIFADLCRRYSEATRHYHTLSHIAQMLQSIGVWRQTAEIENGDALRLAVWFHDAVYDSQASDNEEQSAHLAQDVLTAWGIVDGTRDAVKHLILATKTHMLEDDNQTGALLLDADLAVLGSTPAEYDRYCRAIRDEYDWVSEDAYRLGRGRVLQGFLSRPRIYRTPMAFDAWERAARRNISAEIGRLQG